MPQSDLEISAEVSASNGERKVTITLVNPAGHVAFFVRAEITQTPDGDEILPITYNDNYITVFPHETRTVVATFSSSAPPAYAPALRVEGYNVAKRVLLLK